MPNPIRVLLDESIPEKLRSEFSAAFVVETVRYRGWAGLKNGNLLRAAEKSFDALVTVDKGIRYQQNVASRDLAVVVLDAGGTTFSDLRPLVPAAEAALASAKPGTVTIVTRQADLLATPAASRAGRWFSTRLGGPIRDPRRRF